MTTDADISPGDRALRQLASELDPAAIVRLLAGFDPAGSADRSLDAFRGAVGVRVDLERAAHRRALLGLLRSWGCRHLRTADDAMSSRALAAWWRQHRGSLAGPRRHIVELRAAEVQGAARAFGALASRAAARRASPHGEVTVTFGGTAASKVMFALRPLAFPPWDVGIVRAFGWRSPAAAEYGVYLEGAASALDALAARLNVAIDDLPRALGRPSSSPAKLVDEFLWLRLTRGR